MKLIRNLIYRLRGEISTEELVKRGMTVGSNFKRLNNVLIDDSHAWLIEIGDNVTLAPRVHILAHDASTKQFLGYTKIGRVTIGDNVFVGAETVILPGVNIGSNVVIGANSTVTCDIPDNSVYAGSPARLLCSLEDYLDKQKGLMKTNPVFDEEYTICKNITNEKKKEQKDKLKDCIGFVE